MFYYAKLGTQKDKQEVSHLFEQKKIPEEQIIWDNSSVQKQEGCIYFELKDRLIKKNDSLLIDSLYSLGKNNREIYKELVWFYAHRIPLLILDIPSTLSAPDPLKTNKTILEVYENLSEREIKNSKEKQSIGIEQARKRGKPLGRYKTAYPSNWDDLYIQWKSKQISSKEFLASTGLKKGTFYNLLKEYQSKISLEESKDSSRFA